MNTPTRRLGRGLGSLIAGGGSVSVGVEEPVSHSNQEAKPSSIPPVIENIGSETNEYSAASSASSQLQELLIEQVVPNPHQPRKVIDPQAISELAASINSEGLLQPIVVRPVDNGYELIAGERRWRAHQHLGRTTILARILDATDLSSASLKFLQFALSILFEHGEVRQGSGLLRHQSGIEEIPSFSKPRACDRQCTPWQFHPYPGPFLYGVISLKFALLEGLIFENQSSQMFL